MLPRDRFRSARPLAALLVSLCARAAPLAALADEDEPAREPNALGRELLERFEVRTEGDVLVLDPKAEESAVRTIEIEDDEVVVNGKRFDEEELAEAMRALGWDPEEPTS